LACSSSGPGYTLKSARSGSQVTRRGSSLEGGQIRLGEQINYCCRLSDLAEWHPGSPGTRPCYALPNRKKFLKAQEFVIGGYTLPEGSRSHFGSLLVGYQSQDGLMFAGRVGTGFSEKLLANLYGKLQKLKTQSCPFNNLPEKSPGGASGSRRRSCNAASGSNACCSPRSSLPNGRMITNCVSRCSWDCEPTKRQRMSFVNKS
jgi:hypothetical protein